MRNPFLARALLGATLTELRDVYPGLPALSAPVRRMMSGRLGAMLQRVYHPPRAHG